MRPPLSDGWLFVKTTYNPVEKTFEIPLMCALAHDAAAY